MIKLFLTKILIRLLEKDVKYQDIDNDRINEWLSRQSVNLGYQEYFRKRDIQLLKTIAVGLDRERYLITIGQRLELLNQLQKIDQAGKIVKKAKAKKNKK